MEVDRCSGCIEFENCMHSLLQQMKEGNLPKNTLNLIVTGMMKKQQSTVNIQQVLAGGSMHYNLFCELIDVMICFESQDGSTIVRA